MADHTDDISLIIKTFERQSALERLLTSIRAQGYAEYPVLVADDSKTPYKEPILRQYGDVVDEYIELPFNVGVSKGRNELLKHVETKYFVLHDDDFFYGDETDLRLAKKKLEEYDLDILGGYLFNTVRKYHWPWLPKRLSNALGLFKTGWHKQIWMASIEKQPDGGIVMRGVPTNDADIQFCDLSYQFFMARTLSVRDTVGGWNPKLKSIGEHWEFFYRCKQAGLRVATSKNFVAYHKDVSNPTYDRFRYEREDEMMVESLQAHGVKYLKRGDRTFFNPEFQGVNFATEVRLKR